jgi:hypothetical protein
VSFVNYLDELPYFCAEVLRAWRGWGCAPSLRRSDFF